MANNSCNSKKCYVTYVFVRNNRIKTICNPRKTIDFPRNPHAIRYVEPYYCISENGSFIPDAFFYDGMCRKLRINHYFTKSASEFAAKRLRGRADVEFEYTQKMIEQELEKMKECNEVRDDIMNKWVRKLQSCYKE